MNERITARVVLLNTQNKILLLKMNSLDGVFWLTPGGQMEENETPLEAAKRELFEETGIKSAEFVTPHSWYCEDLRTMNGVPTLFKEHIFLAYAQEEKVEVLSNPDEFERKIVLGFAWWDVVEFRQKGETLFPKVLLDHLDPVLYQNYRPYETEIISPS